MMYQSCEAASGGAAWLSDELLLQICRITVEQASQNPSLLNELRTIPELFHRRPLISTPFELAVTILAMVLGQFRQHQPAHLPFGFGGPRVHSYQWVDDDVLGGIAKQFIGMIDHDQESDHIALRVEHAISESVRLGFLDQKRYDSWLPGMPSGSGWRQALRATTYGVIKAKHACMRQAKHENHRSHATAKPNVATSVTTSPASGTRPADLKPVTTSDQTYAWARQAVLVKATNHVLGGGMLNKGVLSRACQMGKIATNGKSGQTARILVDSFLIWLSQRHSLAHDELHQVRLAVVSELAARNLQRNLGHQAAQPARQPES